MCVFCCESLSYQLLFCSHTNCHLIACLRLFLFTFKFLTHVFIIISSFSFPSLTHNLEPNYVGGGFVAIQDAVKLEPRDQTSPYLFATGNYRIPQTTPSPTPNAVSPSPLFAAPSTSPYHQQQQVANNNLESILQNQLQAPRANGIISNGNNGNIFQQQSQTNQIFTPNIPPANNNNNNYTLDSNAIWTNNLNGIPSTSRAAFNINNNNNLSMTSPIFNQALTPLTQATPVQIFNNNNNEPKSNFSSLLDLDSQQLLSENMLNNLSGELQNLSFGDYNMESFSSKNDINKERREK